MISMRHLYVEKWHVDDVVVLAAAAVFPLLQLMIILQGEVIRPRHSSSAAGLVHYLCFYCIRKQACCFV